MLRHALPNDFNFVHALYMHPQVNPWLLYEPMDASEFMPVYEELLYRRVKYIFEIDGVPVGMCKLIPETHRSAHVLYLGGLAIAPHYAGRSYGRQLIEAVKTHAQKNGFSRIALTVAVSNEKARRLYFKTGFREEGVLKQYTYIRSRNEYLDEMLMALLL